MTILTQKMKTARKDTVGNTCKMFLPWNEGKGTKETDIISGAALTDSSATHNEPHAITFGGINAVADVGLPSPGKKSFILLRMGRVVTSGGFQLFRLGTGSGGDKILLDGTGCAVQVDDGTNYIVAGAPNADTDYDFAALAFDTKSGVLTWYRGVNFADVASAGTANATEGIDHDWQCDDVVTINSGTRQHEICTQMYAFDGALPSDVLTGLNYLQDEFAVGHKVGYLPWKNLDA